MNQFSDAYMGPGQGGYGKVTVTCPPTLPRDHQTLLGQLRYANPPGGFAFGSKLEDISVGRHPDQMLEPIQWASFYTEWSLVALGGSSAFLQMMNLRSLNLP